MEEIKPNDKRARAAVIVFYVLIAVDVVYFFFSWYAGSFYSEAASGSSYSENTELFVAGGEAAMGFAHFSANLVCIVLFVMWFRRAYANLNRLGKYSTDSNDSLAFWGFAIPFMNLYKPHQMMKEVWHKTQQSTRTLNEDYTHKQSTGFILFWWLTFLVGGIIDQISMRRNLAAETYEDFAQNTGLDMFATGFNLISALITVYMIKRIAQIEKDLSSTIEQKKIEEEKLESPFTGEQTI